MSYSSYQSHNQSGLPATCLSRTRPTRFAIRSGRGRLQAGFSTLEMLIAMTLAFLFIPAIMLVSFGSQSLASDSQTNTEALHIAQKNLELALETSRQDYDSVVDSSGSYDIYATSTIISNETQCAKEVSSNVAWTEERNRPATVTLTSLLTNVPLMSALGGVCNVTVSGDGWTNPNTLRSRDLDYHSANGDNPSVNSSAGNEATGIKILNQLVYMTAGVSAAPSKDDFFVLDAGDILNQTIPPIKGSVNTGPGLNGLAIAHYNSSGKTYAFVLQDSNTNQLQVIDATNPTTPTFVPTASRTLPNMVFTCSPASSPCLAGTSIYFYAGRLYIGTAYIAFGLPGQNHEFHVYCVSDASTLGCSPTTPVWLGSYNVNHNIDSIVVKDNYAYLATSDNVGELTVADISSPGSIPAPTKFNLPGNEDGESLYLLGSKLYLGRDQAPASRKDFYILDIGSFPAISILGYKNMSLQSGTRVSSIFTSGKYSFLGLTDSNVGFRVLNITMPGNVDTTPPVSSYNFSQKTIAIDADKYGFIYTANESNDALRIIRPAQCADKIDDESTPDGKIDIADPQCHTDGNANNPASYDPEDDSE